MILKAKSVGELVSSAATRGAKGRVRRTFRNSVYLESARGLILLLRGDLRSPMTVNLSKSYDFAQSISPGDPFILNENGLRVDRIDIEISGVPEFRSSLQEKRSMRPLSESALVKNATAIKLLYSASMPALELVRGRAFEEFSAAVLEPLSRGEADRAYRLRNYLGLIGSGSGFTPSGDDLVGGFASAFNFYALGKGTRQIKLPLSQLKKMTVRESAYLLDYAQRGYVDEVMERLILAALNNGPRQFNSSLSDLASRGHTSGLDMSLGVLLLTAAVSDTVREGSALVKSLRALTN